MAAVTLDAAKLKSAKQSTPQREMFGT